MADGDGIERRWVDFLQQRLHHLPGESRGGEEREKEIEKVCYAGKRLEVNAEVGGVRAENTRKVGMLIRPLILVDLLRSQD